jgi:hypothetical protein
VDNVSVMKAYVPNVSVPNVSVIHVYLNMGMNMRVGLNMSVTRVPLRP